MNLRNMSEERMQQVGHKGQAEKEEMSGWGEHSTGAW
jgi:hypothetical protein